LAVFVELSAWPAWVNATAAATVILFFVGGVKHLPIRYALR